MRVLLLFSSSQIGGAERSLSRMAFASKDVEYQLATLQGEGPWCAWVRSHGYKPRVLGRGGFSSGNLMLGSFWRLIKYIRHNSFDAIYVCGARASLATGLLRVFMPGVKLVHGVRWNPISKSRLDRFFRLIERFIRPNVDAWITNSAAAKKTLVDICHVPSDRVFVIYNGLESLPENVPALSERPLEVLTVANMIPRKGHREYLQVVREVVKVVPSARFIFVGRDDMNGQVQKLIVKYGLADNVRCEGFQVDVSPWYRKARIFVLPSLWNEGCPTSILEAMSFAVPCVAYAMDGIPELVDSGHHGTLLNWGDHSGMASAIIQLLRETELATRQGIKGRDRVNKHFSLNNTVSLHSIVFSQILMKANDQKL